MVRWRGLHEYLRSCEMPEVTLDYAEVEAFIGGSLPASATRWRPQFWSNAKGNGYSRIWRDAGYRTNLAGLANDAVRLVRVSPPSAAASVPEPTRTQGSRRASTTRFEAADVLLIGCVKSKRTQPSEAKDLYDSPLWDRRRRFAEASGLPWVILSAEHGIVDPEEVIAPYDQALAEQTLEYRSRWGIRVVAQLGERFGDLMGLTFELHAGRAYGDPIEPLLRAAGATLVRPLVGLAQGGHLQWYHLTMRTVEGKEAAGDRVEVASTPSQRRPAMDFSNRLTEAFVDGRLDLARRPGAPSPGWHSMPEVRAVDQLRHTGADDATVRTFLTLVAALDRARDADRLWTAAAKLFLSHPWVFHPERVTASSLTDLADALRSTGVTQRHVIDSGAWRVICESLRLPSPVSEVIEQGEGDTATLLEAVRATSAAGTSRYPLLRGEKVATMWVRMLAHPGGASITGLDALPVAVDVQVRKVTEYLGVTATTGLDLERARPPIQNAWSEQVTAHGAVGPPAIDGTGAALDPALWFFAKWGCTWCEKKRQRLPISDVCEHCRFDAPFGEAGSNRPIGEADGTL
jgi:hypothetical protein